ncbi:MULTISPECIES: hypothetical protein [Flavobacteriaceae]|uniref:Uncharacterized protein n=2 Tax=Flavobacteriaceae TaxID=49546 RepID=A0A4Y8AT61_9FLAO|nr:MULTISPECIES: hypothetical protein [Flavobacteriaceae]TEW75038.1 hypothetical protein E2488_05805 [Gramella jeungdoensis]GGK42073.1 hypothetical protein GCM10007963_07650 [Lutibacter litoralis]
MKEIFNNREIALLFWIGILLIYVFRKKHNIESFGKVLEAFFVNKISTIFLLSVIYVESLILILSLIEFWDFTFIKDSIFWYFGVAFITILNLHKQPDPRKFFKKTIIDNFKFVVLFEFISNFFTFSLITEFILIPLISFFVILDTYLSIYSEKDSEKSLKKITNRILSIFGLIMIFYSLYRFKNDYSSIMSLSSLKFFLFPIILTLFFIPFLYFLALYSEYNIRKTKTSI